MNRPFSSSLYRGLLISALIGLGAWTYLSGQSWPQFGGAHRNFKVDVSNLAPRWPATGPKKLWDRELGDGFSGIVVDGGTLYTMYRPLRITLLYGKSEEIVTAIDRSTGKTYWEHRFDAPFVKSMNMENGPGPHSTPLVTADRLYAVGVTGKFYCLDRKTGKVVWFHDLYNEYKAPARDRGYSCSPIAYKNMVILMVGGPGQALMAFNQKDGSVVWKKQNFDPSPSSPILITVDGQDQLVAFLGNAIVGLDPGNGNLLWQHPHRTDWGLNISMPVWGEGNLLFMTSAYSGGARMIQLTRAHGKTTPRELWSSNRMRVHIGNAIRVGDTIYGSSGDFGPAFLSAIDAKTGAVLWQDRSFSKANLLYAGGKFIILDEDGQLGLATATPQGLTVLSRVELLKRKAWTAPTLVGTTLYVRDQERLVALDLG
jgi:outer membrane protein assembly factor BamB